MDVEEKAEALKDMDDEEKEAVQARVTVDATIDITELLAMDDEEQMSALAAKDDKERATVLTTMEDKKAELAMDWIWKWLLRALNPTLHMSCCWACLFPQLAYLP